MVTSVNTDNQTCQYHTQADSDFIATAPLSDVVHVVNHRLFTSDVQPASGTRFSIFGFPNVASSNRRDMSPYVEGCRCSITKDNDAASGPLDVVQVADLWSTDAIIVQIFEPHTNPNPSSPLPPVGGPTFETFLIAGFIRPNREFLSSVSPKEKSLFNIPHTNPMHFLRWKVSTTSS